MQCEEQRPRPALRCGRPGGVLLGQRRDPLAELGPLRVVQPQAEAAPEGETGKARIDASRTVEELGVSLRSPEETLRDAARSLIKLGVAVPASKVGK